MAGKKATTKSSASKKTTSLKKTKTPSTSRKKKVIVLNTQSQIPQQITAKASKSFFVTPKFYIPVVIVVVALVLFLLRSWFIVAIVNGQPIWRQSFVHEMETQDGKQVLDSLVVQTLITQEASKKNILVSQKEIDDATKTIDDQLKSQGQTLDTALAARGMTKSDFEMQIKIQKLLEKLLADKIKVSDKEVADYIDKNKDTMPSSLTGKALQDQVRQQLQQQKLSEQASSWIASLQKSAKITYFSNY